MKSQLLKACRSGIAAYGMFLGISLLAAMAGRSQNFVKNADFEYPLSTNDWTIVFAPVMNVAKNSPTNCGPNDFWIAGRSTWSHKDANLGIWDGYDGTGTNYWNKFGLHFAPSHTWYMHAYAKQVVKGLNPSSSYDVSAWMAFFGGDYLLKCDIFLEAIGGQGSLTTPYPTGTVLNNNPAEGGSASNWRKYTVTTRPNGAGEIEIRLHFNKKGTVASLREFKNFNAFYDHVSVVPAGQTVYEPPFSITSFTRTNQDITLTWQSVMNNSYRLQVSTNLSEDPNSWAWVKWSPAVDTNLYATGAVYTFQTNLTSVFAYDPTIPTMPSLFFRIRGQSFRP
jgi:hypothetical protein